MKVWTEKQVEKHIKQNLKESAGMYSATVVVAALYKKLYGKFPKIGMSGTQAEFANSILPKLPKETKMKEDEGVAV